MNRQKLPKAGCLVSCLSSKFSGETQTLITPVDIDAYLDKHSGYVDGSDLMLWTPALEYAREQGLAYRNMTKIVFGDGSRVLVGDIIEVQTARLSTHFVLCTQFQLDRIKANTILFMDPGTKTRKMFSFAQRKYKPVSIRRLE